MIVLCFDGCSKGNPGPAGDGAVIYDDHNEEIWSGHVFVGDHETNNVAEYHGLLLGINQAIKMGIKELMVYGDSLLVINQMKGIYQVRNLKLKDLYDEIQKLTINFYKIEFHHIFRQFNQRADELANQVIC